MSYESNPQTLTASFSAAGFDDVNVADVITARKDDGRAWEINLDKGGELRATITYRGTRPSEDILPILGRKASIMLEKRTVTTVFFTLEDPSELPAAIQAIDAAVSAGDRGIKSLRAKRKRTKDQAADAPLADANSDANTSVGT